VKFNRPAQRGACVAQGPEGEGIGGEVRFRHGRTATVQAAVDDPAAIGGDRPTLAGRNHVAMGIERQGRSVAEPVADDEVGDAAHAYCSHFGRRHDVALDDEAHRLQKGGGSIGVGGAIARGIVGRDAHQLGQERRLVVAFRIQNPLDLFQHRSIHRASFRRSLPDLVREISRCG